MPALDGLRAAAVAAVLLYHGDVAWARGGYLGNWRFVTSSQSYFAQFTSPSPLQHVWSLAIEEQFYLVWPPVFLLLLHLTRGSRRALLAITTGLAAVSVLLMFALFTPGADPS